MKTLLYSFGFLFLLTLTGCKQEAVEPPDHDPEHETTETVTNRIDVPPTVRQNLGITFVKVERRRVQDTTRLPGYFEVLPTAKSENHATAEGRIDLLVHQYDRVSTGTLLFRIMSPELRRIRQQLAEAELAANLLDEQEFVTSGAVEAARESLKVWEERRDQLQRLMTAGAAQAAQLAEAQGEVAAARLALSDALLKQKELRLQSVELRGPNGENPRFEVAIRQMSALMGVDDEWLREIEAPTSGAVSGARWSHLDAIEVRSAHTGVVTEVNVSQGSYVEEGEHLVSVSNPLALRFRAMGLQADLPRIEESTPVRVVPPLSGGKGQYEKSIPGIMTIGTEADPEERTIDFIVSLPAGLDLPWAREGVSAFVEVPLGGVADEELAIPLAAVVQDGLTRIFFKRDRDDPDKVIRQEADLGDDDGRWVTVESGLRNGDEVVVNGVYELMLSGSGKAAAGGHFHSDGTFHGEEH